MKNVLFILIIMYPLLIKSQTAPLTVSIEFNSKYPSVINVIFKQINYSTDSVLKFYNCFEFQTLGELGKPDITFYVTDNNGKSFPPIANPYSTPGLYSHCYYEYMMISGVTIPVDLNALFRESEIKPNVNYKIKVIARVNFLYNQELYRLYKLESTNYLIYKKN